ncbi:phage major capsid protein [Saccharopolyspora sp. NPDC002376]
MTTKVVSSFDGPRITVNDFIKDPLRIPSLIISMTKQGFLADAVLRNAGQNQAGAVRFNESTPLYADTDAEVRAEFAEVPVGTTSAGDPKVTFVEERALAILASDEMRRRQVVDPVTRQLQQVKNTLIKAWDDTFVKSILNNASINTLGVTARWTGPDVDIRRDLNNARRLVDNAQTDQGAEFAFEADTLIVNKTTQFDLLNSSQFQQPYQGNIADENLRYTGKLPQQILTLDVLVSNRVPDGKAIVMQRNVAGFISDELPLQATPLYRDEPRKTWRSDVQRASAIGIDQPKAITVLSGV